MHVTPTVSRSTRGEFGGDTRPYWQINYVVLFHLGGEPQKKTALVCARAHVCEGGGCAPAPQPSRCFPYLTRLAPPDFSESLSLCRTYLHIDWLMFSVQLHRSHHRNDGCPAQNAGYGYLHHLSALWPSLFSSHYSLFCLDDVFQIANEWGDKYGLWSLSGILIVRRWWRCFGF